MISQAALAVLVAAATHPCPHYYRPANVEADARAVFHRTPRESDLLRLGREEACLALPFDRRAVVRYDRHQAALRRQRLARAAAARAAAQAALRARLSAPAPLPAPAPSATSSTSAAPVVSGYVIPAYVVNCESGGNPNAVSIYSGGGLYGILASSWVAFGGTEFAPEPYDATPEQQGIVAQRILAAQGPGAWQCWTH
jgi:hypothetical protein